MSIDWSKAPIATHYTPPLDDSGMWVAVFWRKEGDKFAEAWQVLDDGSLSNIQGPLVTKETLESMVVRPIPWNGEGFPPVGVPIEAKHKNAQPDWARPGFYETVIVAIGKQLVIFEADGNGCEKVGLLSDYIFRPVRTAEQIAAEEREATLTDIALLMGKDPERPMIREMAAILWDAGYRKQVQP